MSITSPDFPVHWPPVLSPTSSVWTAASQGSVLCVPAHRDLAQEDYCVSMCLASSGVSSSQLQENLQKIPLISEWFKPNVWWTWSSWYSCRGAAAATEAANSGLSTWQFKPLYVTDIQTSKYKESRQQFVLIVLIVRPWMQRPHKSQAFNS